MNRLWVTNKVDKLFGEFWILVSAGGVGVHCALRKLQGTQLPREKQK